MRTWRWARMASVGLQMFLYIGTLGLTPARAQGLGGAGTVQGTVKDPTGGVMVAVTVDISNPVSGFKRSATTDAAGKFVFRNLAPNPDHPGVTAQGFDPLKRDVDVRSAVPIDLDLSLTFAGATSSVEVVGDTEDLTSDRSAGSHPIEPDFVRRRAVDGADHGC